jgi:hypothetical protein
VSRHQGPGVRRKATTAGTVGSRYGIQKLHFRRLRDQSPDRKCTEVAQDFVLRVRCVGDLATIAANVFHSVSSLHRKWHFTSLPSEIKPREHKYNTRMRYSTSTTFSFSHSSIYLSTTQELALVSPSVTPRPAQLPISRYKLPIPQIPIQMLSAALHTHSLFRIVIIHSFMPHPNQKTPPI